MKKIIVFGAGLSGLASAALLAKAGNQVTVLERNTWVGGKSRRIEIKGQIMDTGPALVTFPEVWEKFLATYDQLGAKTHTERLKFETLAEVGRYFLREHVTDLPVRSDHHWFAAWSRFTQENSALTPAISTMLTTHPFSPRSWPALLRMSKVYSTHLTTESYIDSLDWMPKALREVIAIHTLNAGISPKRTLALYASITASMASQGIHVPTGGVNEIALKLKDLALGAGADIRLGEEVTKVGKGIVQTTSGAYRPDLVVSSLDPEVLDRLMGRQVKPAGLRSCSGVAIYAVLSEPLPERTVTHSVIMPDEPAQLYEAIEKGVVPNQTMAFVNYYRPGQIYPNQKPTVAVLLTAPADGKKYDLETAWVKDELSRIGSKLGLDKPIEEYFEAHQVLDPSYFAEWGSQLGALYGKTRKIWQSGPFHYPAHRSFFRPWLYRVGASTHPGGGIPAVLGGVLIALRRLVSS